VTIDFVNPTPGLDGEDPSRDRPGLLHNYLLGELFASQLSHRLGGLMKNGGAGSYLLEHVFSPGSSRRWDRLCETALGAPPGAESWASDLV
jgi:hypothetical protein